MAKYTKDDIVNQAHELAKMIADTEEVDFSSGQRHKSMKTKR